MKKTIFVLILCNLIGHKLLYTNKSRIIFGDK